MFAVCKYIHHRHYMYAVETLDITNTFFIGNVYHVYGVDTGEVDLKSSWFASSWFTSSRAQVKSVQVKLSSSQIDSGQVELRSSRSGQVGEVKSVRSSRLGQVGTGSSLADRSDGGGCAQLVSCSNREVVSTVRGVECHLRLLLVTGDTMKSSPYVGQ
ncbi:hypothetical protein M514_27989 [Trichuris suis]|uniref:Uncharacterized protein n=1 Tax=Trichuris suis TaxID=68888 RepID=A0A085MRI0_9BILA|nr:hypothetical protein M514_27989 [Trichuris suis]